MLRDIVQTIALYIRNISNVAIGADMSTIKFPLRFYSHFCSVFQGPYHGHGLTSIPLCTSDHMPSKVRN